MSDLADGIGKVLTSVAAGASEVMADEILRALIKRFGVDTVRGRIDYIYDALAMADATADERWPKKKEEEPDTKPEK